MSLLFHLRAKRSRTSKIEPECNRNLPEKNLGTDNFLIQYVLFKAETSNTEMIVDIQNQHNKTPCRIIAIMGKRSHLFMVPNKSLNP